MTWSVLYKMDLNREGSRRRDHLGCYCRGQGRGLEIKQQQWETEEKTKWREMQKLIVLNEQFYLWNEGEELIHSHLDGANTETGIQDSCPPASQFFQQYYQCYLSQYI